MKRIHTRIQLSGVALMLALSGSALAQDKAAPTTTPTAAAAPAAPIPAAAQVTKAKADAPPKKRVVKRTPKTACTKLDDPWDNLCAIQKKAEAACRDLPTGKKVPNNAKKGTDSVTLENKRARCVNGYMRNV